MGIPRHVIEANDEADEALDSWMQGDEIGQDAGNDDADSKERDESLFDAAADEHGSDQPLADQSSQAVNWQQRAQVAEGRLKTLGPQLAQLQQEIAQIKQGGNVEAQIQAFLQKQAETQKQAEERRMLREKLADTWGLDDEGLDLFDKYVGQGQGTSMASQAPAPATPPAGGNASELYANAVYAAYPNFQQINNDPGFSAWLQEIDIDGVSRDAKLRQAHSVLNAATVIGIVNQYVLATSQHRNQQANRQQAVQRQIAPSRSHGGYSQPQQEQKHLSPEQIQQFYDRFNRGEFYGRSADWAKIQAVIERSERHYLNQGMGN